MSNSDTDIDRICNAVTNVDLNREIEALSESFRIQLAALRAINYDKEKLVEYRRTYKQDYFEGFATALARERGIRIGRQAARRAILEAHQFAVLQTATTAPWLAGTDEEDED